MGKRLPSGPQAQHPSSAGLQKPGKRIWVPPSPCPAPRCCAAAGSENTIKIMSCYLSIINDQNKFAAPRLITLPDFHLNICKETGPHPESLSDGCKCCILQREPRRNWPNFYWENAFLLPQDQTAAGGGGEEKLGRDEISPVPALCSCLDAAEHLQPQLSTCCLCFLMTAAAQPRLPCPAALSALHAQGQDLGLWPGEVQQSSSEAVLGMLPAHKRL